MQILHCIQFTGIMMKGQVTAARICVSVHLEDFFNNLERIKEK